MERSIPRPGMPAAILLGTAATVALVAFFTPRTPAISTPAEPPKPVRQAAAPRHALGAPIALARTAPPPAASLFADVRSLPAVAATRASAAAAVSDTAATTLVIAPSPLRVFDLSDEMLALQAILAAAARRTADDLAAQAALANTQRDLARPVARPAELPPEVVVATPLPKPVVPAELPPEVVIARPLAKPVVDKARPVVKPVIAAVKRGVEVAPKQVKARAARVVAKTTAPVVAAPRVGTRAVAPAVRQAKDNVQVITAEMAESVSGVRQSEVLLDGLVTVEAGAQVNRTPSIHAATAASLKAAIGAPLAAPVSALRAPAVSAQVSAPVAASIATPAIAIAAPAVSIAAPAVSIAAPAVSIAAPVVQVAAPVVPVSAPALPVSLPALGGALPGGISLGR